MSKPAFDYSKKVVKTETPDPNWAVGKPSGTSKEAQELYGVKEGLWTGTGGTYKEIDPKTENPFSIYRLLVSSVVPRPIGFISSIDKNGVKNLAPYSYFNVVHHNPPTLVASFTHASGTKKDTFRNIVETKTFTVNIISEPFIEASNYTSVTVPPEVSEWELSGLTPVPSKTVTPPRVGESAVAFEVELVSTHDFINDKGVNTGGLVIGEIKYIHVREDLIDPETFEVDPQKLLPVGRMGGITYTRVTETFDIPRPGWETLTEEDKIKFSGKKQ